jgi:hypothetical protein
VILFAVIFAQIVLTQKAGGAHHILMLYPFHHFLAAGAAVGLLREVDDRFRHGVATTPTAPSVAGSRPRHRSGSGGWRRYIYYMTLAIVLTVAGLLVASEVGAGWSYAHAFEHKEVFNPRWSPLIYDVADYVNDTDADIIVFPDWGIHNQVFALGDGRTRVKCFDLWPIFRALEDPAKGAELYHSVFKGERALAVLYSENAEVMPHTRQHFFAFVAHFGGRRSLDETFVDPQGVPIFEVYHIEWPSEAIDRARK